MTATAQVTDDFRNVMGHFATGVTVITANAEGKPVGTTASAFSSLSLDPPMLLICLNKESNTAKIIHETKQFGVNILGEESPDLAMRFASKEPEKFDGIEWHLGHNQAPVLDAAIAAIECTVVEETEGGTHYVFIASADRAVLQSGSPLAYFRGRFGRLETEADIHVIRLISDRIVTNNSAVGTELSVDELARDLDTPRSTVYYALGALRDQGLVYRDDHGVFRVATVSSKMVTEALEARKTIELGAVKLTLGKLDAAQLHKLRELAEATMPDQEKHRTENEFAQANRDFHELLVSMTGNGSLSNVYRQFNFTAIIGRLQHEAGDVDRRNFSAAEEHLELVEAFERNDYDAAVQAIMHHTQKSVAAATNLIETKK